MIFWWLGNAVFFFVVIPVLLALINRTVTPILTIQHHANNILANVVALTGRLDDLPELLAETDQVVREVATGALRYGGAVGKIAELHG